MVTYKTIVVPTDGSENAKRALEHALAVADRNQAELIVVHVANIVSAISNFDQTPISGGYVSEQIAEDMEETGKETLNDVVKDPWCLPLNYRAGLFPILCLQLKGRSHNS